MKVISFEDLKLKGISYSRSHLWRLEKVGRFPKRIALSVGRSGWLEHEVDAWLIAEKAVAEKAAEEWMKLLSYDDLKSRKGISYSLIQLWRLEKTGKFPKRIALSVNRFGWLESEIDSWLKSKVAERDCRAAAVTESILTMSG